MISSVFFGKLFVAINDRIAIEMSFYFGALGDVVPLAALAVPVSLFSAFSSAPWRTWAEKK